MQQTCSTTAPHQHDIELTDCSLSNRPQEAISILVLTRNGHMSEPVMDYALNVAQRLNYSIVAAHVDTLPFFNRSRRSRLFAEAMRESAALFREKAKAKGIVVEHCCEYGKIDGVVGRLCRAKKRIEFVVIDKGIRLQDVAKQSPVPVFPVLTAKQGPFQATISSFSTQKGVSAMSTTNTKRHLNNCILFGALTSGLYAAVFAYQDIVMTYFSKGGVYAVLPVATVFAVSFFHGNFTNSFWSAMGIEASKKSSTQRVNPQPQVTDTVRAPRPDTRPRLQVNA